jgi:NitT/TauT family transport system substrate-binding protein
MPVTRVKWITLAKNFAILGAGFLTAVIQSASAEELKIWRYGVLDAKGDAGFSFMIGQGFAEKQGLKLKVFQFKADTQLLQALLAGELDSFEGSPGNDIMAAARGADVKIIGCTWPGLPHVILAHSVTSVQDLKGKTVAVGPPGSLPELLTRILLNQNNIPANAVHFSSVGNDVDRYKALVAHVVDAAVVSNEFIPVMVKEGLKLLAAANDFAPNFARLCVQSTGKVLATRPDDAAHFMAAEIAALRYAISHRDETLKLTRDMTHEKEDDPRPGYIFDWAVKTHALDPEVRIPVDKLDYIQQQLIATGNLSKPFDINKMVDMSIREKALKLLEN